MNSSLLSLWKTVIYATLLGLATAFPALGANDELFKVMESLANKGDAEAQYHLGMFYNNGIGTPQNTKLAYKLFQKSAAGNDPLGNYKLGCYYSGQGKGIVSVDHDQALKYKLIAAKAGYSLAQADVGGIYFQNGDTKEAIRWLKSAGDQGMTEALYALFNLYYQGNKVDKEPYSAYLYLNLAAKVNNSEMPEKIKSIKDELATKLSAAEKDKAGKIIREWKPQPTALTIKAMTGLQEAKAYANSHKQ